MLEFVSARRVVDVHWEDIIGHFGKICGLTGKFLCEKTNSSFRLLQCAMPGVLRIFLHGLLEALHLGFWANLV